MKKNIIVLLVFVTFFNIAYSQNIDTLTIDDYYIDFSVPDLSALSMLGVENNEIVRPGNLKEFAAGIANFLDSDGSIKPAYAVEWSFLKTFSNTKTYNWNRRFSIRNLALTVASANQDSLGTRLAIGFKWVPIDKSDPLGDRKFYDYIGVYSSGYYQTDIINSHDNIFNEIAKTFKYNHTNPADISIEKMSIVTEYLSNDDRIKDDYKKKIDNGDINDLFQYLMDNINKSFAEKNISLENEEEANLDVVVKMYTAFILKGLKENDIFKADCKQMIKERKASYKQEHWNDWALQLSGGWVANSPENNYKTVSNEKFSFFTSASIPTFNKSKAKIKGQLLVQIKFEDNFKKDSYLKQSFSGGFRHLVGNSDNRWSIEILYASTSYNIINNVKPDDFRFIRYTTGFELKLSDGTWLEMVFGGQKRLEGDKKNSILTTFGFKHAIQSKRRYEI